MSYRSRLLSALFAVILLAALIGISIVGAGSKAGGTESLFAGKTTIKLWYNDEGLTDYLNDVSVSYNNAQSKVRVVPTLIRDNEYLVRIYEATLDENDYPDLYIIRNNELERCWKTGLAAKVEDPTHFMDNAFYPQSAINAVSFKGTPVAYPLSFETAAFLYNKKYLATMAETAGKSLEETVPKTIVDIINLANVYEAPEEVQAVFKWDVSDIFYNYGFVGNYMNVGGPSGDDINQLDIYNTQVISCLQVYQQLNQFFSIDVQTDDYKDVIRDFAQGKIVFTIATSDAVQTIRDMTLNGECDIDYGVTRIPDSTQDLISKPMSVTDCVVVNGYSTRQEEANRFIQYMLYQHINEFYERTGRAPAQAGFQYSDEHMSGFYNAYVDSVPITKLRRAGNFWMLLENTFALVWDGADANDSMHRLTQTLMEQISGTENYVVDKLMSPVPVSISEQLTGLD